MLFKQKKIMLSKSDRVYGVLSRKRKNLLLHKTGLHF